MSLDDRLPDLVGKTLDHSASRMPGEVQMYKMYVERAKEAILTDLLEIIGDPDKQELWAQDCEKYAKKLIDKVRKYCE